MPRCRQPQGFPGCPSPPAVALAARTAPAGSGSSIGGNNGGGVQGGLAVALFTLLTLLLLRLARRAAVQPIWRAYLPEVSPA